MGLEKLFDIEPDDYKVAWNELKHHIRELNINARQTIPSVNSPGGRITGMIGLTLIACAIDAVSS